MHRLRLLASFCIAGLLLGSLSASADEPALPKAFVDGIGPDWKELKEADFADVNGDPETWTWTADGVIHCSGTPIGVLRTVKQYNNFEFVGMWKHLTSAGNSGFFLWCTEEALKDLPPNKLPAAGIEVQMLDHGYIEQYRKKTGKEGPYTFGTNGDVFPVGKSKMTPFQPTSPNGARSWPRKHLSKGFGEWNHYYVRAINGEVRLWVNGEEVSGGTGCTPASGHLCLESEGAPVEFKNIRLRELP